MKLIIKDLVKGDYANGDLLVVESTLKEATNGTYAMLKLSDGVSEIAGKRWQYSGDVPDVGSIIEVKATVGEYNGTKDLNIKRWSPGTTDSMEFRRKGPIPLLQAWEALQGFIEGIEDPQYKDIVRACISKVGIDLCAVPAAKKVHHDYHGGWVQHTLEVVTLATSTFDTMQQLGKVSGNRDLIVAGAILHDIGKAFTYYEKGLSIELTLTGELCEHIVAGNQLLVLACQDLHQVTQEAKIQVSHIITAHHGCLEWGSPVVPKTVEAYFVHWADLISSKSTIMENLRGTAKADGWTDRSYFLGTKIYTGNQEA